jgi:hypothetical protein
MILNGCLLIAAAGAAGAVGYVAGQKSARDDTRYEAHPPEHERASSATQPADSQ